METCDRTTMMMLMDDNKRWQRCRRRHQSTPLVDATNTSRKRPRRQGWRVESMAWIVCLVNALVSWVAAASVITTPFVLWEHQLQSNSTLGQPGRGNGVVLENDSSAVWLTTNSGIIHIVRNGVESIYIPPTKENVVTQCNSSISLYQDNNGLRYAVYAVVDVPYSNQEPITSRLLALSPKGHLRWIATVDGIVTGTPQIGASGKAVYVTHNAKDSLSGAYIAGKLSVFRDDLLGIGGEVPLQDAGAFGFANKEAPFSPLTVVSVSALGMLTDQVYWTEAWDNGQAAFGLVYHFNSSSYEVSAMSRTTSSFVVAPILSRDGTAMYLGGRASTIYGWPQGHSFLMRPYWSQPIDTDGILAIQSQPVLSADGSRLYALSPDSTIACLQAETGKILWRTRSTGITLARIRLAASHDVLFSIQENDGLITKYNALNGRVVSRFDCYNVTQNVFCLNAVDADFAISNDGKRMFYADVTGRLVALEFGDETFHPTITPMPTAQLASPPPPPPPTSRPLAITISPTQGHVLLVASVQTNMPSVQTNAPIRAPPIRHRSSTPRTVIKTPSPTITITPVPTPFHTSDTQLINSMPTKSPSILHFSFENIVSNGPAPSSTPVASLPSSQPPTSAAAISTFAFANVNFPDILAQDDDAMGGSNTKPRSGSNTSNPYNIKPFALTLVFAVVILFLVLAVGVMLGRWCTVTRSKEETRSLSLSSQRWREERQQRARLLRRPSFREVV